MVTGLTVGEGVEAEVQHRVWVGSNVLGAVRSVLKWVNELVNEMGVIVFTV